MPGSAKLMILFPKVSTAGLVVLGSNNGLLSVILTGWTALFVTRVCLDKLSIIADSTRSGGDFYEVGRRKKMFN